MTCDEFKAGFFRVQGPKCTPELLTTVQNHANSCMPCGEVFRGTLTGMIHKEFERVYGDPNGPDVPPCRIPLPEPDHDSGQR